MTPDQSRLNRSHTPNCGTKVENKSHPRNTILKELEVFTSSVTDFRRTDKGNIRHRLSGIIMLMILGRASGCVGRADIIEFGQHNLNKIHNIGILRNGVPSDVSFPKIPSYLF